MPFSEDLVAAYYCAIDPATPARVRGILLAALAYFVLPFDAVPDILAGIGFADDMTVLAAAIAAVSAHILPAPQGTAARMPSTSRRPPPAADACAIACRRPCRRKIPAGGRTRHRIAASLRDERITARRPAGVTIFSSIFWAFSALAERLGIRLQCLGFTK